MEGEIEQEASEIKLSDLPGASPHSVYTNSACALPSLSYSSTSPLIPSPSSPNNPKAPTGDAGSAISAPLRHRNMASASILSWILVSWITPLLHLGRRKPLEHADLPNLPDEFTAAQLQAALIKAWNHQISINHRKLHTQSASGQSAHVQSLSHPADKQPPSNGSLLVRVLFKMFGKKFLASGILKVVGDICAISSPTVLRHLLQFISTSPNDVPKQWISVWFLNNPIAYEYLLCIIIFLLHSINTITVNAYFQTTMYTGLKVRTSITGFLYSKSLRLSHQTRIQFSTGKIVNLMSTDSSRLEAACAYIHYLWSASFQCILIMILLFKLLGWSSFVGLGLFVLCIPVQSRLVTWLGKYRKETVLLTDKRVKLVQEIIYGIRIIKFYAWEKWFLSNLEMIREEELRRIYTSQLLRALNNSLTVIVPIFACILTFLSYVWLGGNKLTATVVFPALAYYNLLRLPLALLPMVIGLVIDARVAVGRIQDFLLAEELEFEPKLIPIMPSCKSSSPTTTHELLHTQELSIKVQDGNFIWETDNTIPPDPTNDGMDIKGLHGHLIGLNFTVKRGELVAIIGSVGSGKSSLLNAMVGEMKWIKGEVTFYASTIGYCQQQAWIQNATVRDNILFGLPYEEAKYKNCLHACALNQDIIEALPHGDMTLIGEKGVNLSGGQKQRISLARLVYTDPDIALLDDPLSAVDAHVGRHIFEHCIKGVLAGKTIVMVTHQLHLLPNFDRIIMMEDIKSPIETGQDKNLACTIRDSGSFAELMTNNADFAAMMRQYGNFDQLAQDEVVFMRKDTVNVMDNLKGLDHGEDKEAKSINISHVISTDQVEERYIGSVSSNIYFDYIRSAGGTVFMLSLLASIVLSNGAKLGNDLWLSIWTSDPPKYPHISTAIYALVYVGWGVGQGVFSFLNGLLFAISGVKVATSLHNRAIQRVLQARIVFFDTNPAGRVINRFSKDQDILDNQLTDSIRSSFVMGGLTITTLLLIIYASKIFIFPLVILLLIYYQVQRFYRSSSRELKRIDALTRSPVFAQFSETLTGMATIRAYRQQDRFIATNCILVDQNNRAALLQLAIQRWLGIRLESIGNLVILGAGICCLIVRTPAPMFGLAIGYALSISGILTWLIRQVTEMETQIISSERLSFYANQLEIEEDKATTDPTSITLDVSIDARGTPLAATDLHDTSWPLNGAIEFRNYSCRYRPELSLVLQSISFRIDSGERVGIVGRTGAGKSSILLALFRLIEASSGSILIDGVDISKIRLERLRRSLSIIPQDPIIFSGTVRSNLDPMNEIKNAPISQHKNAKMHYAENYETYSDDQLWTALEKAHLKEVVARMPGKLDEPVHEGGDNFSVGQRQLLCLARALLRQQVFNMVGTASRPRSPILVLDEATANVDLHTDAMIQSSLRINFVGTTIITIAHRIRTVLDYDRILVLDKGRVVEFDKPSVLLQDPNSVFSRLVRETEQAYTV